MRLLLQRVSRASVSIDDSTIASIGRGYLLFLAVMSGDTQEEADWLARKVAALRLFDGEDGRINDRTILDIGGSVLVVSQFTLAGRTEKGNRPDYTQAASPDTARVLYQSFIDAARNTGVCEVAAGQFQAKMQVSLVNDGPVTLWLSRGA